jgi:hypothetical protein
VLDYDCKANVRRLLMKTSRYKTTYRFKVYFNTGYIINVHEVLQAHISWHVGDLVSEDLPSTLHLDLAPGHHICEKMLHDIASVFSQWGHACCRLLLPLCRVCFHRKYVLHICTVMAEDHDRINSTYIKEACAPLR